MPSRPTVSVLLPVRNESEHLDEAMDSLVSQSFDDFEVIAVDDGSTDGSGERLDAWAAGDVRVRVLRQPHSGIVAALERGRAEARGRYLARMDADDVADPGRLEAQLRLLESEPGLAGCGCGVRYFPDEVVRDGARRYASWLNGLTTPERIERSLFVECPLAHPTFFLRADVVEALGGYRDRGWPEDYDLVLRFWRHGRRLGNVPHVLHRWRERAERLSRTHASYTADAFLGCKLHHLRRSLLPPGRAAVVWGAGPIGKRWSKALRASGTSVAAFVELDPRKIGQEIHGAPVLDPEGGIGLDGPLHLAAVGQEGARARIEETLAAAGLEVLDDYVAVA